MARAWPKLLLPVLIVGVLLWSLGARAQGPEPSLPINPLEGRNLFVSKGCVNCHSVWGEGGTLGPDLGRVGTGRSVLQLAGILWNHSFRITELMRERKMGRPNFTPKEMSNLVSYLYFLNIFDEPGDPGEGERVFQAKRCITCHSVGGKGGKVGPPLDNYRRYMSSIFLAESMWNHGPAITAKMKELSVPRPVLEGTDLANLLAYIQEHSRAEKSQPVYMLPGNPSEGKKVFASKNCSQCHSVYGIGGKVGPDLGAIKLRRSISEVGALLWNHGPRMWDTMKARGVEFPKFSGSQMSDLLSYLYFLQYYEDRGDPRVGARIFKEKGCANCHSVGGSGPKVGPDLSKTKALDSATQWASSMWNHEGVMEKKSRELSTPWPRFDGNEMRDTVEYLKSLRDGAKKR